MRQVYRVDAGPNTGYNNEARADHITPRRKDTTMTGRIGAGGSPFRKKTGDEAEAAKPDWYLYDGPRASHEEIARITEGAYLWAERLGFTADRLEKTNASKQLVDGSEGFRQEGETPLNAAIRFVKEKTGTGTLPKVTLDSIGIPILSAANAALVGLGGPGYHRARSGMEILVGTFYTAAGFPNHLRDFLDRIKERNDRHSFLELGEWDGIIRDCWPADIPWDERPAAA